MKLVILNGPSGVGKSTVSAQLQADIPNSVLIDVDELRRSIPNYKEQRQESLLQSYKMTAEAIEDHLKNGEDVIIDKTISYSDTLDSFIEAGARNGAEVYEFLLFADKETVQKRADDRGYKPGSLLTRERVGELWEKLNELQKQRREIIFIDTTKLTAEELVERIKASFLFRETLLKEGFPYIYAWHDEPGTEYPAHAHKGDVSMYILDGGLTFWFGQEEKVLKQGDRFDVPIGKEHMTVIPRSIADHE